jgi:hypothetical protein
VTAESTRERREVLTHTIVVELPLEQAMRLFTPVGERLWVDGWDPEFPAGEDGDGSEPGTVFLTAGSHGTTFWGVAERTGDNVRYARMTPGTLAGFVTVQCREESPGRTTAEVTYDLTALGGDGEAALREFAKGYAHSIDRWQQLIAAALPRIKDAERDP